MKKVVFILLPFILLADTIINTSVGCPDLKDIKAITSLAKKGEDVNLEIIKRGCRVFYPKEKVKARLDIKEKDGFIQIEFLKTGDFYYIKKKDVKIEQPGRKNIINF
ncbi:hypothetical protein [Nitrosophilus kaiyonis]|uniref:hypothetical protein n=1 Tax=Nitrosophilus kaiyonis TaxID=2930200 RepID=UPI002490C071|nr:hypothetical protein [Nitrosophilus kaiyonis]